METAELRPLQSEAKPLAEVTETGRQGWWQKRTCGELAIGALAFCLFIASLVFLSLWIEERYHRSSNSLSYACESPNCMDFAAYILRSINESVDPCEDFYEFACSADYLDHSESQQADLDYRLREILDVPLTESDKDVVKKMKQFYKSCLDVDEIENDSLDPYSQAIKDTETGTWPMLQQNWRDNTFSWEKMSAQNLRQWPRATSLIPASIGKDLWDGSKYSIFIESYEPPLPKLVYQRDQLRIPLDAEMTFIYEAAKLFNQHFGHEFDDESLKVAAEKVLSFEKELTLISGSIDNMDETVYPNSTVMSVAELLSEYQFDWETFFNELFVDMDHAPIPLNEEIVIGSEARAYLQELSKLLLVTPSETIANYLYWSRLRTIMELGPKSLRQLSAKYELERLGESPSPADLEDSERWSTCVALVATDMNYALAAEYLESYFDPVYTDSVVNMTEDFIDALSGMIQDSTWLTDKDKVELRAKAENMDFLYGYIEWLYNNSFVKKLYDKVPTGTKSFFDQTLAIRRLNNERSLKVLRKVPSIDEPMEEANDVIHINAQYIPQYNLVSLYGAIMGPFLLEINVPKYLNYGAMGAGWLAHEIMHGFDEQGIGFNKDGTRDLSLSETAKERYYEKMNCFIAQYNGYKLPEIRDFFGNESHVDGINTLGENIADIEGLRIGLRAYKNAVARDGSDALLPGLHHFSSEQLFFLAYAKSFCTAPMSASDVLIHRLGDVHSPYKFRLNGAVSNSKEFQDSFQCSSKSQMVRSEKCLIW